MTVATPDAPDTPAPSEQKVFANYWGTDERYKWYFPDGEQYIEFKVMDEGDRTNFQKLTNQDLTIRQGNEAKMKMDPAGERHTLIKTSVIGWHLYAPDQKTGEMGEASYAKPLLEKWLAHADPKLVDALELEIRRKNPWMQTDMTVEQVDEELDRLQDLRREIVEREAGEASSANK